MKERGVGVIRIHENNTFLQAILAVPRSYSPSPAGPAAASSAPTTTRPAAVAGATAMASTPLWGGDLQSRLPNEVWLSIFSFLHASWAPVTPISLVCKRFHVLTAPLLFRHIEWNSPLGTDEADVDHTSTHLAELLLEKRSLGEHARSASVSWKNSFGGEGKVPTIILQSLASLSNLETLQLNSVDLSSELIRTLSTLPSLSRLSLSGCIPPKSSILQKAKDCKLSLTSVTINNVMNHVYLFEDLLSILCSPSVRSFALPGGEPIPSFFLRSLNNGLAHHTLEELEIPIAGIDGRVVCDLLNNQRSLRRLCCTTTEFPRIPLPASALPNLERFEGPDNPEAIELLATGRPLKAVSFRTLRDAIGYKERLTRTFRGLSQSLVPLESLSLKVTSLEPGLLDAIASMFPHLQHLVVQSMTALSQDMLKDAVPEKLRLLQSSRHLHLETITMGPDESYSRPSPEIVTWQKDRIVEWETACPSLRTVRLDKIEWVWMEYRDWLGYDVTPEFKGESTSRWDVPAAATRPREAVVPESAA